MTDDSQLYRKLAYVLRRWRLDADKSEADVYEAAGLAKNVYRRLEDNERPFSALQIAAIAAVYNKKAWELLRDAEELPDEQELPELPRSVREWRSRFGFQS
jgi:transcriptional regulator with XRE-family HTH domain